MKTPLLLASLLLPTVAFGAGLSVTALHNHFFFAGKNALNKTAK